MTTVFNWHQFNWIDYSIIGIILFSTIISSVRGLIREAVSLAAWIIAFWIAIVFAPQLGESAPVIALIKSPSLRLIAAFAFIFIAVLLIGGLTNFILGKLIHKTGLTGLDRVLGIVFGAARGILLMAVVILLAGLTVVPRDKWWLDSQLIPAFKPAVSWLRDTFPEQIRQLKEMMITKAEDVNKDALEEKREKEEEKNEKGEK